MNDQSNESILIPSPLNQILDLTAEMVETLILNETFKNAPSSKKGVMQACIKRRYRQRQRNKCTSALQIKVSDDIFDDIFIHLTYCIFHLGFKFSKAAQMHSLPRNFRKKIST